MPEDGGVHWFQPALFVAYSTAFLYLAGWVFFAAYLSALRIAPATIQLGVDDYVLVGFKAAIPAIIAIFLGTGVYLMTREMARVPTGAPDARPKFFERMPRRIAAWLSLLFANGRPPTPEFIFVARAGKAFTMDFIFYTAFLFFTGPLIATWSWSRQEIGLMLIALLTMVPIALGNLFGKSLLENTLKDRSLIGAGFVFGAAMIVALVAGFNQAAALSDAPRTVLHLEAGSAAFDQVSGQATMLVHHGGGFFVVAKDFNGPAFSIPERAVAYVTTERTPLVSLPS